MTSIFFDDIFQTCDNYICAVMNCSVPPMPLNGRLQIQLILTISEAEIPNNSVSKTYPVIISKLKIIVKVQSTNN